MSTDAIRAARSATHEVAPAAAAKLASQGKLHARERIALLVDAGSFVEDGQLAAEERWRTATGSVSAAAIGTVRSELYDEVVARGWFARRPDQQRATWSRIGWAARRCGSEQGPDAVPYRKGRPTETLLPSSSREWRTMNAISPLSSLG